MEMVSVVLLYRGRQQSFRQVETITRIYVELGKPGPIIKSSCMPAPGLDLGLTPFFMY